VSGLEWQKSSFSGGPEQACIELAALSADPTRFHLRESDDPDVVLAATPIATRALLVRLKNAGLRLSALP
jgi:hypothetical protein